MMRGSAQPLLHSLVKAIEASSAQQVLSASGYHTAGVCGSLIPTSPKRSVPLGLPGLSSSLAQSLLLQPHVRHAGHNFEPPLPGNTVDNWASMRQTFVKDKPNNLGSSYAVNVSVFAFAYTLHDMYFFPPRTLYLSALVFLLLYVRRAGFTPSFPQQW
jgi:hypothetical protein